jgi:hypothetical protein
VKRFKAVIACLMLALWVPASMHCLLEDAGWLAKDESCASAPAGTHDQRDGCQFENGGVQFQAIKVTVPSFDFVASLVRHLSEAPEPSFLPSREPDVLVELVRSWQFTRRAALPVRAPSLLS